MFEEILQEQYENQKQVDAMGMNYLYDEDVEVCSYVFNQLQGLNVSCVNSGRNISIDELINRTLNEIKVFGDDIYSKVQQLIKEVPIEMVDTGDISQFSTGVSYTSYTMGDKKIVISDSGEINKYLIPKNLNELSVYHFGHEQIHAIKETNYNEYVDNIVLGETIPIFYELMIYNPDEVLKKELIKFRMQYMLINAEEYLIFSSLLSENYINDIIYNEKERIGKETRLYEYLRTKVGCYLNSFYYAVILYKMYKETPDMILCLVSRVLNHEMTTLDMLNFLGIYGDIQGEVFEKELGKIRKIIK